MAEDHPPFVPFHTEVQRLFRELIKQPWSGRSLAETSRWQPSVDMCETDKAIIVEIELPGVRREDVRVEVKQDVLYITGERQVTAARQGRNYLRLEQHHGRFARQLPLPGTVNQEAIQAEFADGILTVTLPKNAQR